MADPTSHAPLDKGKFKVPLVAGGVGLFLLALRRLTGKRPRNEVRTHVHDAMQHEHEHTHVTHNRTDPSKGVGGWEHLTATHSHEHNHAAMEHSHRPHRDFEREHRGEAHVHDHDHPLGEGH